MCMCMLNKRTNILFSEKDYHFLAKLAAKKGISIGELVRKAVQKTYQEGDGLEERKKVVSSIISAWEKQKKPIVYKALVEDGRKS
jgi:hypothetical protein